MAAHYKIKYDDGSSVIHCDGVIQPGDVALCGADLMGDSHLGWSMAKKVKAKIDCRFCIKIINHCKGVFEVEIKSLK